MFTVTSATGFTLVLGGGGVPGLAYLAGALTALRDRGIDPASAELVIGTSAGALIGALLRTGCPVDQLAERAIGQRLLLGEAPVLSRTWQTPAELALRTAGASWVLGRSVWRLPLPGPPAALSRVFPGGLATPSDPANIDSLPQQWPQRPLWAVAVNLDRGRRVALGRHPADRAKPFPRAVRASTAVPGVFAPVRFDDRILVDGGVHSPTNLDLAVLAQPGTVICIAPMSYDPSDSPHGIRKAVRLPANFLLRRELRKVHATGARVVLLRPGGTQLERHHINFLRHEGVERIGQDAYSHTMGQLNAFSVRASLRDVSRGRSQA
jgi:NTE family protein